MGVTARDIAIAVFCIAAGCYFYATKQPNITQTLNIKYDYVIGGYNKHRFC